MKIIAFAASSSRKSINKTLATHVANIAANGIENATVEIVDINDYELPLFSEDREAELGKPELAQAFYNKLGEADAIVVSFAEHNGSYTAAYKNLFDWTSRIDMKVFQNKPMIMLATSPGPGGASSVLAAATGSAPFFAADVKASISVPSFYDNFDMASSTINDADINDKVEQAVALLR